MKEVLVGAPLHVSGSSSPPSSASSSSRASISPTRSSPDSFTATAKPPSVQPSEPPPRTFYKAHSPKSSSSRSPAEPSASSSPSSPFIALPDTPRSPSPAPAPSPSTSLSSPLRPPHRRSLDPLRCPSRPASPSHTPATSPAKRIRTSGSRGNTLLRRVLVGAQVFACTALLLVAGLLAKSLIHLSTFDRGFSTDHVAAADVISTTSRNKDRNTFDDGILQKLRALPGVQSASFVSCCSSPEKAGSME